MTITPEGWAVGEDDPTVVVDVQDMPIATCHTLRGDPEGWAIANARLIAATPTMLEALQAAVACGNPHRVSLYDHEAVEGWRWDHPDGREWVEVTGDWSEVPLHPLIEEAIDAATQEGK